MRKRGTVSTLRLLAATAFAPSLALAQGGAPPIRSIDIYGSSVLDSAAVRAEFEPDLVRFIELGWQAGFGRDSAPANAPELEAEMEATSAKIRTALESRTPLAYFEIGVTLDFGPPQQVDLTIDVVEKADEARRMPFHAAPTQDLDDPGGVLALWAEYQQKIYELALAGAPMTVEHCAGISRAVSAILDVADPIAGSYRLEVTSPGLDRPLTRRADFERFRGFEARVETELPIDGRRRFRGRLLGVEGDQVRIQLAEGERAIPCDGIRKAKLVVTDEVLAATAAQRS